MNILVDFVGHADLYYSMHLLFEARLGHKLFRPTGGNEWDKYVPLTATLPSTVGEIRVVDDIQRIPILTHNYEQKAITFEQFKSMDIDFVVATSFENEVAICNLAKNEKPGAVALRQIANIHERPIACKNILLSTLEPMPAGINWIRYHPEHISSYLPDKDYQPNNKIKSFFNYMLNFPAVLSVWRDFKGSMADYQFLMHGAESENGSIPQAELPKVMQDSMFIWHTKPHGGCGYVARQALGCGKPLIVNKAFCRNHRTLANEYLRDGINCIDIDPAVRSKAEAMRIIREWSIPEIYRQKSQAARETITNFINFDKEANDISAWLGLLKQA